ncbi:Hypothetical predicted protein [Cloeon dipterum]|uniref:Uncharacterized protein n=1 Tax=Cloeon dipterum TaxID=197152 RepID=A0A8S1DMM7_9INSE|nr:Hypothetical predicted protein [Cloeon dipterum]CAB3383739.1 Hypothetical predicted protein [Cloeon dipterum]
MHPLPRVIEEAAFGLFHRRFSDLCRAATPCASQSKGLPQIWCQKWDINSYLSKEPHRSTSRSLFCRLRDAGSASLSSQTC